MKERVAGEHFGPVQQPSVQLALLSIGGMKFMPAIGTPPRRTKAGKPQLGTEFLGHCFESVNLANVVTGHNHRDFEAGEPGIVQVFHGLLSHLKGTFAAHRIVGCRVCAVYRDLHIDVVHGGEFAGNRGIDSGAVR